MTDTDDRCEVALRQRADNWTRGLCETMPSNDDVVFLLRRIDEARARPTGGRSMTDAAPREGWYIVHAPDGPEFWTPIYFESPADDGRGWMFPSGSAETLPSGWTLGPRIDDLLREAERYRNALIDAEIARERGDG